MIEKHITLNRNMPGPDHKASLEPDQFSAMVDGIRTIELSLGDGIKRPSPSEKLNRPVARKSLVAACSIQVHSKVDLAYYSLTISFSGWTLSVISNRV